MLAVTRMVWLCGRQSSVQTTCRPLGDRVTELPNGRRVSRCVGVCVVVQHGQDSRFQHGLALCEWITRVVSASEYGMKTATEHLDAVRLDNGCGCGEEANEGSATRHHCTGCAAKSFAFSDNVIVAGRNRSMILQYVRPLSPE